MNDIFAKIDNWELIKLLGGLTIIISSIISFIAYFIKSYFINKWKSKQQTEIEIIKARFDQNNQLISNLTSSLTNVYLSSNNKRFEYLEKIWVGMMTIKSNMPTIVTTSYSILTKEELINLPKTDNKYLKASIQSFNAEEYLESNFKINSDLQKCRPFIGESLWIIYFVYQAFIGRLTILIEEGLRKGKITNWHDDFGFINQILNSVITKDQLEKLMSNSNSFNNVLNFLESIAINDISEQITGKRITDETVKRALEISEILKNTVAQQRV